MRNERAHRPGRDPRARGQKPRPAQEPGQGRPQAARPLRSQRLRLLQSRRNCRAGRRRLRPRPRHLPDRRFHRPAHGRAHRAALGRRGLQHRSAARLLLLLARHADRAQVRPDPDRADGRAVRNLLKTHKTLVPNDRAALVFPGERAEYLDGSALRRRYRKALEKAELRKLRFHDLRHAFGSIAIDQATIVQVQAWMGHADVQTTMKYMHRRSRAADTRLLSAAFCPTKKAAPKRRKAPAA